MSPYADELRATITEAKGKLRVAVGAAEYIAEWNNRHQHIDSELIKADTAEIAEMLCRLLNATGGAAIRHSRTIIEARPEDRQTYETMQRLAGSAADLHNAAAEE